MTSGYQRVAAICTALIQASPQGVRFVDLKDQVLKKIPDLNRNTLSGALNRYRNHLPEDIIRPVRGFYITQANWKQRDKKAQVPERASVR
jgi:hypothetical protein